MRSRAAACSRGLHSWQMLAQMAWPCSQGLRARQLRLRPGHQATQQQASVSSVDSTLHRPASSAAAQAATLLQQPTQPRRSHTRMHAPARTHVNSAAVWKGVAAVPWPAIAAVLLYFPGIILWAVFALRCKADTFLFLRCGAACTGLLRAASVLCAALLKSLPRSRRPDMRRCCCCNMRAVWRPQHGGGRVRGHGRRSHHHGQHNPHHADSWRHIHFCAGDGAGGRAHAAARKAGAGGLVPMR